MPIATNPETGEVMFLDAADGAWKKAQTAINPQTKEMLALDGVDWKPVPVSKGILGHIDDAVRSIASGITFGWADEFAAKMDEAIGKGNYDDNVKKERAKDAQIPIAIQLPGEVAGAVGSTVLTAPLAAWRALAAMSANVPRAVRFGALGAGEGALAGAGNAEEGSRGTGAATGAGVGAGIGAVAPKAVEAVTGMVRNVRGAVQPSAGAAADVGRALVRDEDSAADALVRLTNTQADRPGATLADVGGENVRGLVERVAQTPGAGRTQVVPALTARQEQQADRIVTDLRSLTGTARTATQAIDDTIAERATAAKPLYDDAFNFNARAVPEIVEKFEQVTSTGFGKAVLDSKSLRNAIQTEYGIKDVKDAPLMVLVDAWKKQVDDLVGTAKREGKGNAQRVLTKMRDDVVGVVDEFNPAYKAARDAWSGPSAYLDAIEEGRGILSRNVSADEFAARFAKLSNADKEAVRTGAISSIVAKIGNDGARLADITKYLRSPEMRAKITAIMPSPETAQAWQRRLQFEVKSSEMTGRALGNSATARRLSEKQDAENIVGDLVMDAMMAGPSSTSFLRSIFTAGPRWLRDTLRSRTDKELADVLTNPARAGDLPAMLAKAAKQRAGTSTGAAATTAAGVTLAN